MDYETILFEQDGGILTITLNRPDKLNAVTDQMLDDLKSAFKTADRDASIRAVILTGAGRGFCPGQDLQDAADRAETLTFGEHLTHGYNPLIMQMRNLSKPIIGAINGVAAGAGMSIAVATDIRIASDKASFLQAFVKIGLVPDSGSTWMLSRLIGPTRALELMLTGEKISAEMALEWGLVSKVVPHDDLMDTARALAETFAKGPTKAYDYIKRAYEFALTSTLEEALANEADMQDLAGETEDYKEGVMAFIEKRTPNFKGE